MCRNKTVSNFHIIDFRIEIDSNKFRIPASFQTKKYCKENLIVTDKLFMKCFLRIKLFRSGRLKIIFFARLFVILY